MIVRGQGVVLEHPLIVASSGWTWRKFGHINSFAPRKPAVPVFFIPRQSIAQLEQEFL